MKNFPFESKRLTQIPIHHIAWPFSAGTYAIDENLLNISQLQTLLKRFFSPLLAKEKEFKACTTAFRLHLLDTWSALKNQTFSLSLARSSQWSTRLIQLQAPNLLVVSPMRRTKRSADRPGSDRLAASETFEGRSWCRRALVASRMAIVIRDDFVHTTRCLLNRPLLNALNRANYTNAIDWWSFSLRKSAETESKHSSFQWIALAILFPLTLVVVWTLFDDCVCPCNTHCYMQCMHQHVVGSLRPIGPVGSSERQENTRKVTKFQIETFGSWKRSQFSGANFLRKICSVFEMPWESQVENAFRSDLKLKNSFILVFSPAKQRPDLRESNV